MALHGFTWCEQTVASKKAFDDRSFRWVKKGKGRVLVACPKGHWHPRAAKNKRCDIGLKAYKLYADRDGRCGIGERPISKFSSFFRK